MVGFAGWFWMGEGELRGGGAQQRVEGLVLRASSVSSGGGPTCRPTYRYAVDGQEVTGTPARASRRTCAPEGSRVALIIDPLRPEVPVHADAAFQETLAPLVLGFLGTLASGWGLVLTRRRRAAEAMTCRTTEAGRQILN